jgi:hypothetical protein
MLAEPPVKGGQEPPRLGLFVFAEPGSGAKEPA